MADLSALTIAMRVSVSLSGSFFLFLGGILPAASSQVRLQITNETLSRAGSNADPPRSVRSCCADRHKTLLINSTCTSKQRESKLQARQQPSGRTNELRLGDSKGLLLQNAST